MRSAERSPLMGSIEKLSGNPPRYRARAWNPIMRRKETVKNPGHPRGTWATAEEAQDAWVLREQQFDNKAADAGVAVVRLRRRVTFADYAAEWLRVQTCPRNTLATYRTSVNALNKTFSSAFVDDITAGQVEDWLKQQFDAKLAPGTRQGRLFALRKIMRRAIDMDHIRADDPTARFEVDVPKSGVSRQRILKPEELDLAMAHLPAWFAPGALLAYDSGLRACEVAGLAWDALDLTDPDDATVAVIRMRERDGVLRDSTKNRKDATIPVTPRTAAALIALREAYPAEDDAPVFRVPGTEMLSPQYVGDLWRVARTKAGLTKPVVKFHDLRHACATNLARAGHSAMMIMTVLRHSSLSTSQRYIDAVPHPEMRSAMRAISENGSRHLKAV